MKKDLKVVAKESFLALLTGGLSLFVLFVRIIFTTPEGQKLAERELKGKIKAFNEEADKEEPHKVKKGNPVLLNRSYRFIAYLVMVSADDDFHGLFLFLVSVFGDDGFSFGVQERRQAAAIAVANIQVVDAGLLVDDDACIRQHAQVLPFFDVKSVFSHNDDSIVRIGKSPNTAPRPSPDQRQAHARRRGARR